MAEKLTNKQLKFIEQYLIHGNGTKAAIEAGYSENTAHVIASENLNKPKIQEVLNDRRSQIRKQLRDSTDITVESLVRELAGVAFTDISEVIQWKDGNLIIVDSEKLDPAIRRGIRTIKQSDQGAITISLHDKINAIEKIAKLLGFIVDKKELTGKDGQPLMANADSDKIADLVFDKLKASSEGRRFE